MRKCECGNLLGATMGNVTVVQRPCTCEKPGPERSPRPRIGLPAWISREHYDERKRMNMPMILPAEKRLS